MVRIALVLTVLAGVVLSSTSCTVQRGTSEMAVWHKYPEDAEVVTGTFDLDGTCRPFVTGTGRKLILRKVPEWVNEILHTEPGRAFRVVVTPYKGYATANCPGPLYVVLEMEPF